MVRKNLVSGIGVMLSLILISLIIIPNVEAAFNPRYKLVRWYTFDNNVSDASGHAQHGTIAGNPAYGNYSSCFVRGCLKFDGTGDWVSTPIISSVLETAEQNYLGNGRSYTLSFGMNYTSSVNHNWGGYYDGGTGTRLNGLTTVGSGSIGGVGYVIGTDANTTYQGLSKTNGTFGRKQVITIVHVASGSTTWYVNGVVNKTYSNNRPSVDYKFNLPFFWGARNLGGNENEYIGFLDEIRVYNYSLSQQNVTGLYGVYTNATPSPTISAINYSGITSSIVVINWTTDIASNTSVNYGTTKSLGTKSQTNNAVTSHSRTLTDLGASTLYFFNVTSCTSGGCAISGPRNFTTHISPAGSITSFYPLSNTQFNTNNITLSTVVNIITTPTNVSFFINGQKNKTISTSSGIHNVTFNRLFATSHSGYNLSIQLQRASATVNSSSHLFYVDSANPTVATTFLNQSVFWKYGSNFTAKFNFSDINLFSYNISINGKQQYMQTGLTVNFTKVNLTRSPASFNPSAMNNITARVADGHTTNKLIDTYQISPDGSTLYIASTRDGEEADIPLFSKDQYPIGEMINALVPIDEIFPSFQSNLQHISIEAIDGSQNDVFTTKEEKDRYTWTYIPENQRDTYQFEVTTDSELFIVDRPELEYKTWIVTSDKWVDFLLEGEPYEDISIEQTSFNSAIVTITGLQYTEKLSFRSLGELNIVTKTYAFFVYANNPPSYTTPNHEITYSPLSITINQSNQTTTTARLVYNGVNYPTSQLTKVSTYSNDRWNKTVVTPTKLVTTTINASWNYTVSSSAQSSSKVIPFNQVIIPFSLTNCSSAPSKPGINFTVVDIDTGAAIPSIRANGIFSIWTNPGLSPALGNVIKTFSISANTNSTDNTFNLCINTNKTIYIQWTLNYQTSTSGYNTGQSIVQSLLSDLSPENISNRTSKIYSLPLVSSASAVVINIIDKFGVNLVGYFTKMWLVRPGLPDVLTTSFITDFKGEWQVAYNSIRSYRFDIYNPQRSTLLFTTNTTQVTTNPFVIQIPSSENDLRSLQAMTTLGSNVTCTEGTLTCRFTWNNPIIRTAYFEVYRVNGWGSTLINNSRKTTTSGTLSYTVTENTTGNTYHAVGSIDTNTNNSFYVVGQDDLLAGGGIFSSLGDLSTVIFTGFFIVLTLALLFIDIGPIGLTIGMMAGLLLGSIIGLIPLTMAGLLAIGFVLIIGLWFGRG